MGNIVVECWGLTNIKERFKSLNISVDWNRFNKINKYRNNIEHYYSSLNHESIQTLISESFLIIRNFISDHLNENPRNLLGKSWDILIEIREIYEKEEEVCFDSLQSLTYFTDEILEAFQNYLCKNCGSSLIKAEESHIDAIDVNFICRSCNSVFSYQENIEDIVSDYFSAEVYYSYKDGGESPITDCPDCAGVYMCESNLCSSCGYSAERICQRCSTNIIPEELYAIPYCGYCDNKISKRE